MKKFLLSYLSVFLFITPLLTSTTFAEEDTEQVEKICIQHLKDYNDYKTSIYQNKVLISDLTNFDSCNTPPEILLKQKILDADKTFELQKNNPRLNALKLRQYIEKASDMEDTNISSTSVSIVGFDTALTKKEKEYCNSLSNERPCLTQDLLNSFETLDKNGNVTHALITDKNIFNYTILYKVTDNGLSVLNKKHPLTTYEELTIRFNKVYYYYWLIYHTNSNNSFPNKKIIYQEKIGDLKKPTKEGYTFKNWTDINNKLYTNNSVLSKKGDLNLYANYIANKYTLYFDANGGNVSPTNKTVTFNNAIGNLPIPNKSGYTFLGWYTSRNGGNKITSSTIYKTTSNSTIYAHWKANNYTLNFNANGGNVTPNSKSVTYNEAYGDLPTPTRTGYSFNGWYTEKTSGERKTKDSIYNQASNSTLFAHWTINKYSVTWKDENGKELKKENYKYGSSVTSPNYDSYVDIYHLGLGFYENGTKYTKFTMPARNLVLIGRSQESTANLITGHDMIYYPASAYGTGASPAGYRVSSFIETVKKGGAKNLDKYKTIKYSNYGTSHVPRETQEIQNKRDWNHPFTKIYVNNYPSSYTLEQAALWARDNQHKYEPTNWHPISKLTFCANKSGKCQKLLY